MLAAAIITGAAGICTPCSGMSIVKKIFRKKEEPKPLSRFTKLKNKSGDLFHRTKDMISKNAHAGGCALKDLICKIRELLSLNKKSGALAATGFGVLFTGMYITSLLRHPYQRSKERDIWTRMQNNQNFDQHFERVRGDWGFFKERDLPENEDERKQAIETRSNMRKEAEKQYETANPRHRLRLTNILTLTPLLISLYPAYKILQKALKALRWKKNPFPFPMGPM